MSLWLPLGWSVLALLSIALGGPCVGGSIYLDISEGAGGDLPLSVVAAEWDRAACWLAGMLQSQSLVHALAFMMPGMLVVNCL